MRKVNLIVVHCSATREDQDFTEYDLDICHRRRGFNGPGYHYYIRKNGQVINTRPVERVGADAKWYNAHSIGVCYEGGLNSQGQPEDTRTEEQKQAMEHLIEDLLKEFPGSLRLVES